MEIVRDIMKEIVRDIMKVISDHNNKISPTKLMRFSNLSFQMFEEYLAELEEKELISAHKLTEKKKVYSLTNNGFIFFARYKEFNSFLDEFGF